jgi:NAD(P)-dependent dehydrogenase (short-subunit alcohol dehydrogenase family)
MPARAFHPAPAMLPLLQSAWRSAKQWRYIRLGPVRLSYKFSRQPKLRSSRLLNVTPAISHRSEEGGFISPFAAHQSARPRTAALGSAVVVGAGPGLGNSLAQLFAEYGHPVAIVSRSSQALSETALQLRQTGVVAGAYACDVTDERSVVAMMRQVESELGSPELVVYAVQSFSPGTLITTEACAFEEAWRAICYGAFLVSREAARRMVQLGRGSILLAGATSGTKGRKGYINLAVGKFGLRALAQVMASELGPQGVHVAHVVIDGDIAESDEPSAEPQIEPLELAQTFYMLHRQPRSCWTSEIDVRPSGEVFWEHC